MAFENVLPLNYTPTVVADVAALKALAGPFTEGDQVYVLADGAYVQWQSLNALAENQANGIFIPNSAPPTGRWVYVAQDVPGIVRVQDAGTPLALRPQLNFTGSGINSITDDGANDRTNVDISGGGGGSSRIYSGFAMPDQAQATQRWFTHYANDANSNNVGTSTDQGNPGINNGQLCPLICPASTLDKATLTFASAAVSTGTQDASKTLRLDVYRANFNTRTLLTTLNFTITTTVGINNNVNGNNFTTGVTLTGIGQAIAQGELIGLQFTNQSGSGNINGLSRAYCLLEFVPT